MQFKKKIFVLAGQFESGDKFVTATQMIEMAGGKVKDGLGISKNVDYLVLGGKGAASWKDGICPQIAQVEVAREKGQDVSIVSEETLMSALAEEGITFAKWQETYSHMLAKERKRLLREIDAIQWSYDQKSKTLTIDDAVLPDFLGMIEDAELVGLVKPGDYLSSGEEEALEGVSKVREYGVEDIRKIIPWTSHADEMEILNVPNLLEVPQTLFAWSTNLTYVCLPMARVIGNSAFYECKNLVTAEIPDAIVIGGGAFAQCLSLAGGIECPKLQHVGPMAFSNCRKLKSLRTTRSDRTRADGKVFKGTRSSLHSIGEGAFLRCESLKPLSYDKETCLVHDSAFHKSGAAEASDPVE